MSSPFRSKSDAVRVRAALAITIDDVLPEIERLRAEIKTTTPARRRALRTRLRAIENHYQGWADYVGKECPRVKNATERPKTRSTR